MGGAPVGSGRAGTAISTQTSPRSSGPEQVDEAAQGRVRAAQRAGELIAQALGRGADAAAADGIGHRSQGAQGGFPGAPSEWHAPTSGSDLVEPASTASAIPTATRPPGPSSACISGLELVAEIESADQVGLDVFGVGEHHRAEFSVSAPADGAGGGGARTRTIRPDQRGDRAQLRRSGAGVSAVRDA